MADIELLLEAERRGILPPEKAGLLAEARRRGLVSSRPVDSPERQQLQAELNRNLASADEAGKKLEQTEAAVGVARPFLRGAVDLADGVLALPRLAGSIPVAAYNAATDSEIPLPISQSVADVKAGAREALAPRNDAEQLASTVTRNLGGVLGGFGIGGALGATGGAASTAANVGRALASNPTLQTVGAVTGGAASEAARRAGGGAVAQTLAGVAGGIAPGIAASGGQAVVRGLLRGGEAGRKNVEQNIQTFARAGTTPSAGQATEGRGLRATEQVLSGAPGGAAPIVRKATQQAEELAANIEARAAALSGRTSAEQAGRRISEAIEGPGGFVQRSRVQQENLYNALDAQIPPATPTSINNTQARLSLLTRIDPGAPRTSASLVNPRIQQIANDLAVDAQSGAIPYATLKALRTSVGALLDDSVVADVPQKQLKSLYSALSDDLREAATRAGPAAERAFNRANNYTRARAQRLEILDEVLAKNGGPEAVFKAAISGTAEGATRLRAVMQSLDDQSQRVVTATVLRRLGRATPGQQNDLSDKFSSETFLTNVNRLSPEARAALFDRYGPRVAKDFEAVAKVASNLRDGSKVFANPSGTGQRAAAYTTAGAFLTALGTGQIGVAGTIAAGVGSTNLASRLLTNPRFVQFLAESTRVPASLYPTQLNQLAQLAQETGDQDLVEGLELLKETVPPQFDAAPPKVVFADPAVTPQQIAVTKASLAKSDPATYRALVRDFLGASYSNASPETQDPSRIKAVLPAGGAESLTGLVNSLQDISAVKSKGQISGALAGNGAASVRFLLAPGEVDEEARNAGLDALTDALLDPGKREQLQQISRVKDPERRLMLIGSVLSGQNAAASALGQ